MINLTTNKQENALGIFEGCRYIGQSEPVNAVGYNPENQVYTMTSSSESRSGSEFLFAWKKLKGDFIVTAQAEYTGTVEVGWMARQSLDANTPGVSAVMGGGGKASLNFSKDGNLNSEAKVIDVHNPEVIQLERKGNTFIMSVAKYGETFVTGQINADVTDDLYIGLCVRSGKAVFKNVRVSIPVNPNYIPYTDYIGSYLEVMEVASGLRKIIYQVPYSIQAPNWTPDGKTLIFNSNGLLFNFDLASLAPSELPTDFANDNNNDHVLTFDGKLMGISHHSKDDEGKSIIYYLQVTGGKPVRVTPQGPSYLHGWSPDGRELVYTGGRNGIFNIYKISKDGGEETRLTTVNALDDGPEYTPDGRYIYFNSTRTGKMKIWRMKPDGSDQEQVTFDEYNDWFPHFSPDGKWIVILSYMPDLNPLEHPFYKHVYIRLMPAEGGQPRVIAYLYGGQGTINVPSWSPDGKYIAFVSNSDFK